MPDNRKTAAEALPAVLNINERDTATILAALRYYQSSLEHNDGMIPGDVDGIATNMDTLEPLGVEEIDGLCERINFQQRH